jgi:hypothetical protein
VTCSLGLAALRALRVGAALGDAITVNDIAVTTSWASYQLLPPLRSLTNFKALLCPKNRS